MNIENEVLGKFNDNGIFDLTINRPKQLNALNHGVLSGLRSQLREQSKNKSLKGLILRGAGEKAFVAGADIKQMQEMSSEEAKSFTELGQEVTLLLESLPVPTVAMVQGFALGGGCEMAMACDFIYATENAIFGQPEVKLGLIPGFGGTQRLARYVGRNRAKELVYSGSNLSAEKALAWGLVNELFEDTEKLEAAVQKFFKKCLGNSPLAIARSKHCINEGIDLTIAEGLKSEALEFSKIFSSFDMKEGTSAFIDKRVANFKGE